ncbi:hypothetical protein NDN08_002155 [Rhodosorus marinus]|uniref:Amino acid transporter transmembrane domain-containing protein n=1 Tax=Rhodosorus marinus TaxID=101924 RepID=A0AAV8UUC5_9RHOD|nr:hypothetical protein NDN08_002155 [Rhodosorus marinus]
MSSVESKLADECAVQSTFLVDEAGVPDESLDELKEAVEHTKDIESGGTVDETCENLSVALAMFLLVVDVVGTGVLTIPNTFATLGWIPGHLTLLLCWGLSLCAGLLLWRLRHQKYKSGHSYPQLFFSAFGKKGLVFARFNTYPLLFLYTAAFSYTQAQAWSALFSGSAVSLTQWMIIAGFVSLVVLQLRSFKAMAFTSIIAIVTIILPIGISFFVIASMVKDPVAYPVGQRVLFSYYGTSDCVIAAMDILYAFAGAVVFLEIMSAMKLVKNFPYSLVISQTFAYLFYATTGSAVYGLAGDATWLVSPYTNSLQPGAAAIVANVCVVIHVSIAIVIKGQILIYGIQRAAEPFVKRLFLGNDNAPYKVAKLTSLKPAAFLWWFLWALIVVVLETLLNIAIPSFEIYLALISSLIASQTMMLWPAGIDIYAFGKERKGKKHLFTVLSGVIFMLGLTALILGLYGGIVGIIQT